MPEHKIVDTIWFSQGCAPGIIGIVIVDNGFEIKAYMGTGFGFDAKIDALHIAQHGARLHKLTLDKVKEWLEVKGEKSSS